MYVELLRRSNISPCKQYSKWVLTFLVVLPKLILTIGALNGIEPNQHNQYFQEKIYSIFSPCCSLVVRARRNSLCACLALGTESLQAAEGRLMCFMRELHVSEYHSHHLLEKRVMHEGWGSERDKRWSEQGCCPWNAVTGGAGVKEDELAICPPAFPVSTHVFSFGLSLAWTEKLRVGQEGSLRSAAPSRSSSSSKANIPM